MSFTHRNYCKKSIVDIIITNHKPSYRDAFKALNKEWIEKFFVMEEPDHRALDNPEQYILDNGGCIKYALYNNIPIGVCALVKCNEGPYDYELAKMGVTEKYQSQGIGKKLAKAIIEEAKSLGAKNIFLESNRKLKPAMKLYESLGFVEIEGFVSEYSRSDIQMVITF